MIRSCTANDFNQIHAIINDGAEAYRGIIPPDRLTAPYMSEEKLRHEIACGVNFWGFEADAKLIGVMGLQKAENVTLLRHAYVRSSFQKQGIGGQLLSHLRTMECGPMLIGTWADAKWAIKFYERHGFHVVTSAEKDRLLRRYWIIPERQVETSVVLADTSWRNSQSML